MAEEVWNAFLEALAQLALIQEGQEDYVEVGGAVEAVDLPAEASLSNLRM